MNEDNANNSGETDTEEEFDLAEGGTTGAAASRARNKTVMLTPEMTGQVRAMLGDAGAGSVSDPLTDLLPPVSGGQPAAEDAGVAEPKPSSILDNLGQSSRDRRPTGNFQTPTVASQASEGSILPPPPAAAPVEPAAHPPAPAPQQVAAPNGPVGGGGFTNSTVQLRATEASKIIGFLVSFDKDENGEVVPVKVGRWLLTSRATEHGDFILINDETISPLHAIVRATKDGKIQVLDQLSEHGTGLIRSGEEEEEELTGAMASLDHADTIRFGERKFIVCLIPGLE